MPTSSDQDSRQPVNDNDAFRREDASNLAVLSNVYKYSLDEVSSALRELGFLPAAKATLSRFATRHPTAPETLPGLSKLAIRILYDTETGIAQRLLLEEHQLRLQFHEKRNVNEKEKMLLPLIQGLRDHVRRERRLLESLKETKEDHELAERALDAAVSDYVHGQTSIYLGRLEHDKERKRTHFVSGRDAMLKSRKTLQDAFRRGARVAEAGDLIVGVTAGVNAYFASYEIDELEDNNSFSGSHAIAIELARPLFLLASEACAIWTSDARVAFNAADLAARALQDSSAGRLLLLASELDGYQGPLLDWYAEWMLEPLAQNRDLVRVIMKLNVSCGARTTQERTTQGVRS